MSKFEFDKDVTFLITRNPNQREQSGIIDNIPLIDSINFTDEKGKTTERKIRYIPGTMSIFADEQPKEYDSKWEKAEMRPKSLPIYNGSITIKKEDINLLKYMWMSNYNASNPSRKTSVDVAFRVFDPESIAKRRNIDRDLRVKAESKVQSMDKNELRAHIITMEGGATTDSLLKYRTMEVEELRDIAYGKAYSNPTGFLNSLNSPTIRNKYILINAMLRGIINFNEQTNQLSYPSGDVLMAPANGMNGLDALAELAETSDRYKLIVEELKEKMITRMTEGEKKSVEQAPVAPAPEQDIYDVLIKKCIDSKIISLNASWFLINNRLSDPADKVPVKIQGKNDFKKALKDNGKALYLDLISRLEELEK